MSELGITPFGRADGLNAGGRTYVHPLTWSSLNCSDRKT